jgi:hypothetical protein
MGNEDIMTKLKAIARQYFGTTEEKHEKLLLG